MFLLSLLPDLQKLSEENFRKFIMQTIILSDELLNKQTQVAAAVAVVHRFCLVFPMFLTVA